MFGTRSSFYAYVGNDPTIGRFLSEDPLGFEGGDVNFYAYAANNPLRFNDPTGLHSPGEIERARRMIMNAQNPHPGVSPGFDGNKSGGSQAFDEAARQVFAGATAIDAAAAGAVLGGPAAVNFFLVHPEVSTAVASGVAGRLLALIRH